MRVFNLCNLFSSILKVLSIILLWLKIWIEQSVVIELVSKSVKCCCLWPFVIRFGYLQGKEICFLELCKYSLRVLSFYVRYGWSTERFEVKAKEGLVSGRGLVLCAQSSCAKNAWTLAEHIASRRLYANFLLVWKKIFWNCFFVFMIVAWLKEVLCGLKCPWVIFAFCKIQSVVV